MPIRLERALFVVAPRDSGKSTTLRSLFKDRRLGTAGEIPASAEQKRLAEIYWLSNERRLYLRLTSPHEVGENIEQFLSKTTGKMVEGRWCFAAPLQPDAYQSMPDIVQTVRSFCSTFAPERVRVAFLSPTRHGVQVDDFIPGRDLLNELVQVQSLEIMCIDARRRGVNGLLLADFFDFT
jgi:hypothetical protein